MTYTAHLCLAAYRDVPARLPFMVRKLLPAAQLNGCIDAAVTSYLKNYDSLPRLPTICGNEPPGYTDQCNRLRKDKAMQLALAEIAIDQKEALGLIAGGFLFLMGGAPYVLLCIVGAVAGWAIESELQKRYGVSTFQLAATECALAEPNTFGGLPLIPWKTAAKITKSPSGKTRHE